MLKKLASRKFLVALGTIVLEAVGINLPSEIVTLAGIYIGGESVADAAGAFHRQK